MNIDDLLKNQSGWLKATGPSSDVVISSRVRLARNLVDFRFSQKLQKLKSAELLDVVETALSKCSYLKKGEFVQIHGLSELDRQFLVERHLISRELANTKSSGAVYFTDNEIISVMVLEEDHLRMQTLTSGFNLTEAWRIVDQIDTELGKTLSFCFDVNLGYLTACPTNVGTGLRASCMVHLPALVMTKQVNRVLQAVSKLNMAVRGLYGEGTQAIGNFFQFSNQVTLGHRELDIIDNLERVVRRVLEHEKEAREALFAKKRERVDDQIWRALGVLRTARLIPSKESTTLLSLVRLGVDMGSIPNLTTTKLNELFLQIQPAHLQKLAGKRLSQDERDIRRAELIRGSLKDIELN